MVSNYTRSCCCGLWIVWDYIEMIEVYYANLNIFQDDTNFTRMYNEINAVRKRKIDKYTKYSDKKRALLAGILLKYAIIEHGIDYDSCEFLIDESGYEHILNKTDVFFSISHAEDVSVCAFSDSLVGVDIENKSRFKKVKQESLSKRIMTSDEYRKYYSIDLEEKNVFMSRIWTRKEAFSKVCKKGLAMDFSKIDTLDEKRFRTFDVYNDYCISVASDDWIDDEKLERFDVTADLEAYNA